MPNRPIIAIAGLACETSTFTPTRTLAAAFYPQRGNEIVEKYDFLRPRTPLGDAAEWRGALTGHALPGGIVTRDAFEELSTEIIARLTDLVDEYGRLDGLWYEIHGAMCVEGLDDVEAELLRRIRIIIGPDVIVSTSMDLHGNVSRELLHQTDLITCYRMAPHEDVLDTNERACCNLIDLLKQHRPSENQVETTTSKFRPIKAWIPLPVLLPGEQTSTRIEPAKRIYAAVPQVEDIEGIIDAAIWVGYAWADEPRNHAVVVVTGWDEHAVVAGAETLAKLFWNAHEEFVFVAPSGSFKKCLDTALASKKRPFFISDSGDNPTAGGSGDMTWGLAQLLARHEFVDESSGPTVIYASVPGPKAVQTAVEAGIGTIVTVTAGAEVDNIHSGPITITGRVHSIKHGDKHAVIEIVLQVGSVFVIVTKLRKPYHHESDFTDLDLQPRLADIVIVKIGYLEPELYDMAADWMLGLTPGGVDQNLTRLGHRRILRPMWPFDRAFATQPDLTPRIVPSSNEPLSTP